MSQLLHDYIIYKILVLLKVTRIFKKNLWSKADFNFSKNN